MASRSATDAGALACAPDAATVRLCSLCERRRFAEAETETEKERERVCERVRKMTGVTNRASRHYIQNIFVEKW